MRPDQRGKVRVELLSSCADRILISFAQLPFPDFFLLISFCAVLLEQHIFLTMMKDEYHNEDDAQLAQMGHKSELKRHFSLLYVLISGGLLGQH